MSLPSIGFIGLGAMGLPMAKLLVKAGYPLHTMIHQNQAPREVLEPLGAEFHNRAAEIIQHSEVVITILPADPQMESVLLSDETLSALKPNQTLIEMTSSSPQMMHKVEEVYRSKGVKVLDAPVSGGTAGAQSGQLTVMAGGEAELLEDVRTILDVMAGKIIHVGKIGDGKAVKAINQMMASTHMLITAEAVALGEKLGVEMQALFDVIKESSGASWMFVQKYHALLEQQLEPGFKLKLMKKDLDIAVQEGAGIPLPLASSALQWYEAASRAHGEMDFAAVSRLIRDTAAGNEA
ncbi:NAD(P)-dependent oxidoreductase [Marinicrinis sediminis]|uniref:NAD(P)-dependent oxidoreductase n=1 Tax=Marinicrinis sediminis TaxID=1652465 RepID=A0ABW5RAF2_9BACL